MSKRSSRILLPTFILSKICEADAADSIETLLPAPGNLNSSAFKYYRCHQNHLTTGSPDGFNLLPVVLKENGEMWHEASLFILVKAINSFPRVMSSYRVLSDDLAAFSRFLAENSIDFKLFPKNKLFRPTYRFLSYLKNEVSAQVMESSTARRRMGTVVSFYRWLFAERIFQPDYPMWEEREIYLQVKNSIGFSKIKRIETTDLKIPRASSSNLCSEVINDGGGLRPLSIKEKSWIFDALDKLNNQEIKLMHYIAIYTGARLQTVLTLRVGCFMKEPPLGTKEVPVKVGLGTLIDTKNNKKHVLFFPCWLYKKIQIYIFSDRAIRRRGVYASIETAYVFYTNRKVPYYNSKDETKRFNSEFNGSNFKEGGTVRQYMRDRIVPYIRDNYDANFNYRFHDLRATFGMDLTEAQLNLVDSKKITMNVARDFVRARMGHESLATTDLYLKYKVDSVLIQNMQVGYERRLKDLSDIAMKGEENGKIL